MTLEDEIKNHRAFVDLVAKMRVQQQTFFAKGHSIDALTAAKTLERKVDEAIRRFRNQQLELF